MLLGREAGAAASGGARGGRRRSCGEGRAGWEASELQRVRCGMGGVGDAASGGAPELRRVEAHRSCAGRAGDRSYPNGGIRRAAAVCGCGC